MIVCMGDEYKIAIFLLRSAIRKSRIDRDSENARYGRKSKKVMFVRCCVWWRVICADSSLSQI
jgi:hypothetical protein